MVFSGGDILLTNLDDGTGEIRIFPNYVASLTVFATATLYEDFNYIASDPAFIGTNTITININIVADECAGNVKVVEPINWYDSNILRAHFGVTSYGVFDFTLSNPLCTQSIYGTPHFSLRRKVDGIPQNVGNWFGPVESYQSSKWALPVHYSNLVAYSALK